MGGAFTNFNREGIADQLVDTFKHVDYDIREENPFESKTLKGIFCHFFTSLPYRKVAL